MAAAAKNSTQRKKPTAGSKKVAPAPSKTQPSKGSKGKAKAPKPKWSKEQTAAALRIQAHVRGHLARKHLQEQRAKAAKMETEMEELRQKAWLAQVEYERKQEAKRRKQAQEEAKRRKEEANLRKDLLEASFDGEDEDIQSLIAKAKTANDIVETADSHGNTLLSEAAAGGSVSTIELLVGLGANPNSRGEFQRTPLWRACFLGKTDCVRPLLNAGADPRIGNETGELPADVAANDQIKSLIGEWDTSETDRIVAAWEVRQEEVRLAQAAEVAVALKTAEDGYEDAKNVYDSSSQALKHARQELEKRITEYDTCVAEAKPEELIQVALDQIHAAEATVEEAKAKAKEAGEKLDSAKLELRAMQATHDNDEDLPGIPTELRDLDDILIRDVGNTIKNDGRWPCVIDVSSQASVFLRYADTNYANAISPKDTQPDRLRKSLLGAIRYGKPFVLDIMDVDMWGELPHVFDAVEPNLFEDLMSKRILENEGYLLLVRKGDGEAYDKNQFQDSLVDNFKCIFLTSLRNPADDMVEGTYALRIKIKK